ALAGGCATGVALASAAVSSVLVERKKRSAMKKANGTAARIRNVGPACLRSMALTSFGRKSYSADCSMRCGAWWLPAVASGFPRTHLNTRRISLVNIRHLAYSRFDSLEVHLDSGAR